MNELKKPNRSLKTILMIWFLIFSIVPLAFLTGYSIKNYEKAIDNELMQRLTGNAREISVIMSDFKNTLIQKRNRYFEDTKLLELISKNQINGLKNYSQDLIKSELANTLNFFDAKGQLVISVFKDAAGNARDFTPDKQASIYLPDETLKSLGTVDEKIYIDFSVEKKLTLIILTKLGSKNNKNIGFIEQSLELDKEFFSKLKQRMKLELLVLKKNGEVAISSHEDFNLYRKDYFNQHVQPDSNIFFDLNIRDISYGFIVYPVKWGESEFYLAIGASKTESKSVLKKVNYAFYSVVGIVIILLVIMTLIISNIVLKPLNELVKATENIQNKDTITEIPIKSDTEIGLLTESFNRMSKNVVQARLDLKKKILELESINKELMDTQAKLVHSSKMISLGQLVAGVAHELNNPISFIFSNISHLRDYAERLVKIIESDKKSEIIAKKKTELEFDYISKDLIKLIGSCEEGAKRTRDIVVGLRNFSRLEEAVVKEANLQESIENTLQILSGEIKSRIQIHKQFSKVPLVQCYASQINQVFMNILSNAVQAIENQGEIWINIKSSELNGKEAVEISIQDSGIGMTQNTIEKIFDPFFSTKTVGQGTGLGLSITYGIIQSHGGDIAVKSQPKVGTEFIITIPVKMNS